MFYNWYAGFNEAEIICGIAHILPFYWRTVTTYRYFKQQQLATYSVIYIYLARAKSNALDIIYSLLKQNKESCNAKRRRQRERLQNNNSSN